MKTKPFNSNNQRLRVPRASNIRDLKMLFTSSTDKERVEDLLKIEKFNKKIYLMEYLQLMQMLQWIKKNGRFIILTDYGRSIKQKLTNENTLTESERMVLKDEFLKLNYLRLFLENVFHYNKKESNAEYLSKEEIEKRYASYRHVTKTVIERESRILYNWLLDLNVIESIKIFKHDRQNLNACYHITENRMNFDDFSKIIKPIFFSVLRSESKKSEWVEIPSVRSFFCIKNSISKELFNNYFIRYINKNPMVFQLSTGSMLRSEVKREGILFNNKLFFYIKISEVSK